MAHRITAALLLALTFACRAPAQVPNIPFEVNDRAEVSSRGASGFASSDYEAMEHHAKEYAATGATLASGEPRSYVFFSGIRESITRDAGRERNRIDSRSAPISGRFTEHRSAYPDSTLLPLLEALHKHADGWSVRGDGFASTVSPIQWAQFKRLTREAWQMLVQHKPKAHDAPYWYLAALWVSRDAEVSDAEQRAVLAEGIQKFPDYYPLYLAYIRKFSRRWGGDYEDLEHFVSQESPATPQGDERYARLYTWMDELEDSEDGFFADSAMSWPRFKAGYEAMIKRYPDTHWHQATLAKFACRIKDADTYRNWRPTLDAFLFRMAEPRRTTLADCDKALLAST